MACVAVLLAAPNPVLAATYWWAGPTDVLWSSTTSWSTVSGTSTPNPAVVPGSADVAVFNVSTVTDPQTVYMNGNRSVLGLSFIPSGSTTIAGGTAGAPAANTLTIGSTGITLSSGAGPVTISTAGTLTNSGTYSLDAGTQLSVSSPLAGSLLVSGSGTMTSTGGGAFSTRVVLSNGANFVQSGGLITTTDYLMVGGNGVSTPNGSTGAYTLNSGTLRITNGIYLGWRNTTNTSGTFIQNGGFVETQNDSQGLQIGIGGGSGAYVLNSGTLFSTFGTGGGSYAGSFTFGGGTFRARAATTGPNSSSVTTTIAAGATALIDTNGFAVSWNPITGASAAGLTKLGSGTLTMSVANTYTGTTRIVAGAISISNAGALQNTTLDLNAADSGTISAISVNGTFGGLTGSRNLDMFTRTLSIGNNGQSTTYGGTLSNGALTKIGSGTLTLSGSNAYSGATTISAGALAVGNVNALGSGTTPVAVNAGTLDLSGYSVSIGTLSGSSGGTITSGVAGPVTLTINTAGFGTFGGVIQNGTGTVSLTKQGSGTLALSASNAFTGGVSVAAGTLQVGNDSALGTGTLALSDGVTVSATGATARSIANVLTLAGNATLGDTTNSGALTFTGGVDLGNATRQITTPSAVTISSAISGGGGLTKAGAGTLTLSASNSFTGGVSVAAGILRIGNNAALGTGTLSLSDGVTVSATGATARSIANVLTLAGNATLGDTTNSGALTFTGGVDLGNATRQITTPSAVTISLAISGGGGLTKAGAGTLTLSGSNTYSGTTTITQGAIAINSANALPGYATAGRVSVASGATLTVQSGVSSADLVTIATSGTFAAGSVLGIDTTGGSRTVSGNLSGGFGITKSGANTLVLSGNNTYSGNTLSSVGTLQAGSATAFGTGTVSTSPNAGTGAVDLNGFSSSNPFSLGSQSTGPSNGGALQNTNTSTTSVLSGNVVIGGDNYVGGNGSITFTGTVSGGSNNYNFFKQGNGTWLFANTNNTFNGFYYAVGGTTEIRSLANLNQPSSLGQPTTAATNKLVFGFGGGTGGTLLFTGSAPSTSDRRFEINGDTAIISRINASGVTAADTLTLTGTLTATAGGSHTFGLGGANSGTNTFSGPISNGSGTVSILKDGSTTWRLSGANTYTGSTTLANGTLLLDYATQNNSKLGDAGVLALGSGTVTGVTLELAGGSHTEAVGSTTILGPTTITRSSGSSVIQLGTITRSGSLATLSFTQSGIATTSSLNTNGILGAWAIVGGTTWATNATNAANGSIDAYTGYTDVDAQGGAITSDTASNVRINAAGTSGPITLATGTTDINTLLQATATDATLDTAGKTLRLGASGGVLIPAGNAAVTFGTASGDGTLTAGGAANTAGTLSVNTLGSTTATINAAIANNGTGVVSLAKSGPGTLALTGTASYTGSTLISGGTIALSGGANRLGSTGALTLAGGGLDMAGVAQSVAGVVVGAGGGSITGSGTLTNTGTYTLGAGTSLTVAPRLATNLWAVGSGTMTFSGGLNSTSVRMVVGGGATLIQNGGSATTTNYLMVGGNDGNASPSITGTGVYILQSGTLTITSGIYLGWLANSNGTFIQNGGLLETQDNNQGIQIGISNGRGAYVLNSGTLVSTFGINGGPYAGSFTFGGGTFRARGTFNTNSQSTVTTSIAAGATAAIDTNGQTVTWSTTLTGPAANGLVKSGAGTLVLTGNYTGNVSVTGGLLRPTSATSLGTGTVSATGTTSNSGAVDVNGLSFANDFVIGSTAAGPSAGGSLQNTAATTSVLSGNVSIGGENYVGGNGGITFNGVVSGGTNNGFSLYKQGTGTWLFTNTANTFDGFYYQIGGTTEIKSLANVNETSSLGRPTTAAQNKVVFGFLNAGGGTLLFTGSAPSTSDRDFELAGDTAVTNRIVASGATAADTLTLTGSLTATRAGGAFVFALGGTNAGVNTFAGQIANRNGTISLLKDGSTTWRLTGSNTYTGSTTISAGVLELAGGANRLATTSVVTVAGGTLNLSGVPQSVARVITGTGGGGITGSGTLTNTGTYSLGAGTQLTASTPLAGNLWAVGSGTMTYSGGLATTSNRIFVGSGGTLVQDGGSAATSDYLMIGRNNGTGGPSLTGTGSYVMQSGTLTVGNGIYMGWGGAANFGTFTQNGGFVETQENQQGIQIGLEGGRGAYVLNSGTLFSNFGTFNTGAAYSGTFTFGGGTFRSRASFNTNLQPGVATTIAAGATAFIDTDGKTVTWTAPLTGASAAGLTKLGSGTLVLSGSNTYAGTTSLAAGTLRVGSDDALSSGPLALNGGQLSSSGGTARTIANATTIGADVVLGDATNNGTMSFTGGVDLGGATRTLTTPSNVTIASAVTGAGGLTKAGAGRLTLSGSNGYTGNTTIAGGTLALSGAGSISSSPRVNIDAGATLDVAGASGAVTIGALSGGDGTSQVRLGGNSLTSVVDSGFNPFGGVISGSGGFTKAGPGQLDLTSLQTFTGTATIAEGMLLLGAGNALATAQRITVLADGILESPGLTIVNGQTLAGYGTINGDLTFASGAILSPGGSVGGLEGDFGNSTLSGGMTYVFEINDAAGTAGVSPGWDLYSTTGTITLDVTGSPILLDVNTLAGTVSGSAANFNSNANYAWKFLVAGPSNSITYQPSWFSLDTTGFANATNGSFYVARGDGLPEGVGGGSSNELYIVYAAVPEPGTLALAGIGLAAAGWMARRRPRRG